MFKRYYHRFIQSFLASTLISVGILSHAQIIEIPLENRTAISTDIVEGTVISQFSFWDDNQHNIYTAHKIQVFKLLKGGTTDEYIELITPGGTVGLQKQTVQPSLQVSTGDVGVFFLKQNAIPMANTSFQTNIQLKPTAGPQGFIEYDVHQGLAADPFAIYDDPEIQVLESIQTLTGQIPTSIQPYDFSDIVALQLGVMEASSITSFTPTTATAGTQTTITITGNDFGSSGVVRFSNADDGGNTYIDGSPAEIISWNNSTIVVQVNSYAGTGTIQVVGNGTATSVQTLTVPYAQINAVHEFVPYPTRHINRNDNGGYIWQMHTDFNNHSSANAAFVRAMDSWRCNSGVFWEIGSVTATDVIANDDVNIVRFDNGSELDEGTGGVCTSRFSGCYVGSSIEWYVEELDIVFNDGTNWNYDTDPPTSTEFDFETVAVHELGHGHQLGHVIDPSDLMHFSTTIGTYNRDPSVNNLACSEDVQSRSIDGLVCGQTAMFNYCCESNDTDNDGVCDSDEVLGCTSS